MHQRDLFKLSKRRLTRDKKIADSTIFFYSPNNKKKISSRNPSSVDFKKKKFFLLNVY